MRQAVAEMIGEPGGKDLGFVLQAAERARMDDTIAIALEFAAIGMGEFRVAAAGHATCIEPEPRKHELLLRKLTEDREGGAADGAAFGAQGFEQLTGL